MRGGNQFPGRRRKFIPNEREIELDPDAQQMLRDIRLRPRDGQTLMNLFDDQEIIEGITFLVHVTMKSAGAVPEEYPDVVDATVAFMRGNRAMEARGFSSWSGHRGIQATCVAMTEHASHFGHEVCLRAPQMIAVFALKRFRGVGCMHTDRVTMFFKDHFLDKKLLTAIKVFGRRDKSNFFHITDVPLEFRFQHRGEIEEDDLDGIGETLEEQGSAQQLSFFGQTASNSVETTANSLTRDAHTIPQPETLTRSVPQHAVITRDRVLAELAEILPKVQNIAFDQAALKRFIQETLTEDKVKVLDRESKNKLYFWASGQGMDNITRWITNAQDDLEIYTPQPNNQVNAPAVHNDNRLQDAMGLFQKVHHALQDHSMINWQAIGMTLVKDWASWMEDQNRVLRNTVQRQNNLINALQESMTLDSAYDTVSEATSSNATGTKRRFQRFLTG